MAGMSRSETELAIAAQQHRGSFVFTPQPSPFTPFTGMEGVPNPFGGGPLGMGAQMISQQILVGQMTSMGMSPLGLSDTSILDRMRHQQFTESHNRFVQANAEADRINYMRTAHGLASAAGVPWNADLHAAAQTLSSGVVSASPLLAQIAPEYLDEFGGKRGSKAVMAHYMHLGGKYRIDPDTGRMGMSNESLRELMQGVYSDMFAGDRYLNETLSAGRAGQLFQTLQMRGMMPGSASLDQLAEQQPLKMREMYSLAGITEQLDAVGNVRKASDLTGEEREKLLRVPQVQQELKAFDSTRVTGAIREWGKAIEAMREIFGDAGYPNAPMPALIDAINRMTGGGMSQLNPSQVSDLVRTTFNLANQTGMGMSAASAMTQQATQDAMALGLNPVFGARAAQQNMAFVSAYQGMGVGAYQAWGRGDLERHQQLNQQLFLQGAASAAANQMAVAMRLDDLERFDEGTAAYNYVQAIKAGQTEFERDGKMVSTDMEEGDFVAMLAESGRVSQGQALFMLQQQQANQEYLFKSPEALQAVRQLQGEEFIERRSSVAQAAAHVFTRQALGPDVDMRQLNPLMEDIGRTAMDTFMESSGEVATDREQRNQAMADAMRQRIVDRALEGDAGAQQLLDRFAEDEGGFDTYLNDLAENVYASVDQHGLDTDGVSLQDRHALHNTQLLRRAAREQGRARVRAMMQESLAPLGKGSALRRGIEAVMNVDPDEDRPITRVLGEAVGGVQGSKIAEALESSPVDQERLGRLQELYRGMESAEEAYANADTDEERKKAFDAAREQAEAFREESLKMRQGLEERGLLFSSKVDRRDTGRVIRHLKFTQEQAAARTEMGENGWVFRTKAHKYLDKLQSAGILGDDATVFDMLRLRDSQLRKGGLGAEELDEIAGFRKTESDARRAARSHVRNVEDTIAKLMSDEVSMLRIGPEGLENIEKLRDTQQELQMLAVEKFDGDMVAAMDSKEGKKLLEQQYTVLADYHNKLEDPDAQYSYLGKPKELAKLRGIAARLAKDKKLASGSLESLLNLSDEQLEQRRRSGEFAGGLSDSEVAAIKAARDKREGLREQYIELASNYRKEGQDVLQDSLEKFFGDSSLAEEMTKSETGVALSGYLQGTGMGNLTMRAFMQSAAEAAAEYHDPDSDLSKKERRELEEKYGPLLSAYQSDSLEEGGTTDPEELLAYLQTKQKEFELQDDVQRSDDGTTHFSIGRLDVHEDGTADLTLTPDAQGP